MAGTTLYKNTANNAHRARYMTSEDNFASGMKYSNAPHMSGFAKSIVNYNLKNDGECLTPRGGLTQLGEDTVFSMLTSSEALDYCVHHSGTMYINTADKTDAVLCQYMLVGTLYSAGVDVAHSMLIVEHNGTYITATYDSEAEGLAGHFVMKPALKEMHGMPMEAKYRAGMYTSIEANTYVLVNTGNKNKLGRIYATFNNDQTAISWYVKSVDPTEVQPTQAMNYGYNMLKDNPYTFENTRSSTGGIELTGVLPYGEDGRLLLTARPGTPIDFKLYYKYTQTDVDNNDKYLVQWEVQDLNNASAAEVVQKVRGSHEYTPGEEIVFHYSPAFTAFSLIVRLYKKSEMDAQDAEWEKDTALQALVTRDEYLTPNRVTTLASYYLTSNSSSSVLNVDAVEYDLGTSTGICTWMQRLVMWGVSNAKSTLFVSEINDPGYMPYPNNSEIFNDDIICAVPYMSDLLVFTKTALYKLVMNADGISYTTTCVQERLAMEAADVNTVVTVQNMVYFKSGNYFYMIVPDSRSSTGGVQMAPVSRPIEQMLDYMNTTVAGLLNDVYNMNYDEYTNDIDVSLYDYFVYLDDTQIRNVYKVKVNLYEGASKTPTEYYIDLCLNYDTVLRAWTSYMYQSTEYRMTVYKPTVTGKAVFVHLYVEDYLLKAVLAKMDDTIPKDTLPLTEGAARKYGNYQLIDTGYRDFSEDNKKRFREVQFCVNIIKSAQLQFHTAFVVDDVETVPMYKHVISQCTDKADPNYGTIFVERELLEGEHTPSLTTLDTWELDTSIFPDITVHKVRYHVSGKGYGGAVKILSLNEVAFELLHINWVYRVMFAR